MTNDPQADKTVAVPESLAGSMSVTGPAGPGPRWAIIGIFVILFFASLYLASSFVLPVVFTLLFKLVLNPVVRLARRRLKIWEPISAGVLVFGTLIVIVGGFYVTSGPLAQIASNLPVYVQTLNEEIEGVRERFLRFELARNEAGEALEAAVPTSEVPRQQVVLTSPALIGNVASGMPQAIASLGFSLIFLFFLLSSSSLFYQKLIESMPTFSDKRKALAIAYQIEKELSRYFLTITTINACLGVAIGTAMSLVGLPMPAIFGVLAFLLNFIPYLGSMAGIVLVGLVGLTTSGDLGGAVTPMLVYLAVTSIEGQIVTPILVGRKLRMNAAAIFLAIAFWGWIWGIVGMFLAVPLMVVIKVVASYVTSLQPLANFLSGESPDRSEADAARPPPIEARRPAGG